MDRIIFDALGNIREHTYGLRVAQRRLHTTGADKGVTSSFLTDILSQPIQGWDSTYSTETTGGLLVEYYRNMISDTAIGQKTNYPFISSDPANPDKFIDMPWYPSEILSAGKVLNESTQLDPTEFTSLSCVHIVADSSTWQCGRILPNQLPNSIVINRDTDFVEYSFMLNSAKTKIVAFRIVLRAHTDPNLYTPTEFVLGYGYNRVEGSELLAAVGTADHYIRLRVPRLRNRNVCVGVIPIYDNYVYQVKTDNSAGTSSWNVRVGADYLPIPFCQSIDYPEYRGLMYGLAPDDKSINIPIDVTSFLLDMKVAQRSSQYTVR